MGGMDFGSAPAQTLKAWLAQPHQGGRFIWRGHETQGFTLGYPMAGFQPLESCHHGADGDERCRWGEGTEPARGLRSLTAMLALPNFHHGHDVDDSELG